MTATHPLPVPLASYAASGVDIDMANHAVDRMKAYIATTRTEGVLSSAIGNFGGMFALGNSIAGMNDPVLVSSIDGVGTKLKLAFMTGRHSEVAGDLVNHCINDILVQGARPLFFLDYFATGKLDPEIAVAVVAGLSESCREAGCALIGGETAEMPGMYQDGEYDLAGTIVGIVDRNKIVTGEHIQPGDIAIALASDGLHTNGFSLARHVLFEQAGVQLSDLQSSSYLSFSDALLAKHRCYAKPILKLLEQPGIVKGMSHITGGGLLENIPRSLPKSMGVSIDLSSWTPLTIFSEIQRLGRIERQEMFRVFNMGIGYVLIVEDQNADSVISELQKDGEQAFRIGTVTATSGVELVD